MRGDTAGPANGGGNGGNGHGERRPRAPARAKRRRRRSSRRTTTAAAEALTDEPPVDAGKLQGLDLGPACGQCGGMMQRTGLVLHVLELREQHRLRVRRASVRRARRVPGAPGVRW